jgi:hypothetical protein
VLALGPRLTARPLDAERVWRSGEAPAVVWATALDFPSYRTWWPWLVEFDPPPLAAGESARAVVRAPAGYRLAMDLALTEVDAPHHVRIDVSGDIVGHAVVDVAANDHGSDVILAWSLAPDRRLLRLLGILARPILVHGHDWILDDGLRRTLDATGLDLRPV